LICGVLRDECETMLWTDLFRLGEYTLEALEEALDKVDFAVIVGTPDDRLIKRAVATPAIRDNLVLELGLFTGKLGRRRAFLVMPRADGFAMPSDLLGLTLALYDGGMFVALPEEQHAAMQTTALEIRSAVLDRWARARARAERETERLVAAERTMAIGRLFGVVVDLRDLLITVPSGLVDSLADRGAFDRAKDRGAARVRRLYEQWEADARLVRVRPEFEDLSDATAAAIREFPYPDELAPTNRDLGDRAIQIGKQSIEAFRQGGNPLRAVVEGAASEVEGRLRSIQNRYLEWWKKHSELLRSRTTATQDALMRAMLQPAPRA
jgi:hypothetical protein